MSTTIDAEVALDNRVVVMEIGRIEVHPNADRLEIAHITGWSVVVQKGMFKAGQAAVYFPIDSVLPPDLEAELFPPTGKIKLSKSRIKTIKLRGAISQGMLVPLTDQSLISRCSLLNIGDDLTDALGVTHYEPTAPTGGMSTRGTERKKHKYFPEYTKIAHWKNYPDLFTEGEMVVVTEKIHGTNFRAGWVPMVADTWWKKVKNWFGYLPEWEFVFGSHRVNMVAKPKHQGFYKTNVYQETVEKYDLEAKIPKGHIIYGEIYGDGIQKGYHYGCADGERNLRIFDVLAIIGWGPIVQNFLSWDAVDWFAKEIGVETVPVVYKGKYVAALVKQWEQGPSAIGWVADEQAISVGPSQPHREGCVIKPWVEAECWLGRKMQRSINPEYLLISDSDWH